MRCELIRTAQNGPVGGQEAVFQRLLKVEIRKGLLLGDNLVEIVPSVQGHSVSTVAIIDSEEADPCLLVGRLAVGALGLQVQDAGVSVLHADAPSLHGRDAIDDAIVGAAVRRLLRTSQPRSTAYFAAGTARTFSTTGSERVWPMVVLVVVVVVLSVRLSWRGAVAARPTDDIQQCVARRRRWVVGRRLESETMALDRTEAEEQTTERQQRRIRSRGWVGRAKRRRASERDRTRAGEDVIVRVGKGLPDDAHACTGRARDQTLPLAGWIGCLVGLAAWAHTTLVVVGGGDMVVVVVVVMILCWWWWWWW